MADVIVFGTLAFGIGFTIAWLSRADLRAWMEQPKHRFQDEVRRYDDRLRWKHD